MSTLIRLATLAGPYSGIGALVLGLLHWFFGVSFIGLHILFGSVVTASLLVAGVVAMTRRDTRLIGALAVVFAPVVPIFGMTQMTILVGGNHWIVRVAHLLVGAGAIALTERIGDRDLKGSARQAGAEAARAA